MNMGVHHPYHLDLCADDEDPSQLIIQPGWDAPHVRFFPRTFCAWPCLLRQVGTVLGSPYDYVVARLAYVNPGPRQPCRDPGYAYVIPVTTQSHGEPRAVPTCLSRQGQAQNTLGKHHTRGASHPGRMIN